MVGFGTGTGTSGISTPKSGISKAKGFRSLVPEFEAIPYYDTPFLTIEGKPFNPFNIAAYEAPTEDTSNNDNNDQLSSSVNNLNYIDDYNTSIVSEEDNPTGGMTQANIDNPVANPTDFYGNPISKEVYGPTLNPLDFVPGLGLASTLNEPAVPTSGYGTPGTYSSISGGKFDANSRAYDPITGQYLDEYGTKGAFASKIAQDPLGNLTGDPDKAAQGKLSDMEYAASRSELASLGAGTTDPTGNPATTGLDPNAKDKVATKLGLDMGFASHTVAPGTPTHTTIKTGVYTPGSQYIPGGKITDGTGTPSSLSIEDDMIGIETDKGLDTSGIDVSDIGTGLGSSGDLGGAVGAGYTNTDSNNNVGGYDSAGVQSGSQASHSGGYGGYADDAASSDSGGGGK